jgi:hypothetical protein
METSRGPTHIWKFGREKSHYAPLAKRGLCYNFCERNQIPNYAKKTPKLILLKIRILF